MALLSTTGSEAVAVALRLARAYTGRAKVVKFEGHYHGWFDGTFASGGYDPLRSGPADRPAVVPATAGIAPGALQDLLVAPWNDVEAIDALFAEHGDDIAALILEPVNVNGGVILPAPGFLQHVRDVTRRYGALLVFDEVITGFRIALGGAQAYYGVRADLAIFAKAVAGGLPLSAVTGPREIMNLVASGRMIHNGTFNGNALAGAAAEATLGFLTERADEIYPRFETLGIRLAQGLAGTSPDVVVRQVGPIVMTAFNEPPEVRTIRDRANSDVERAARLSEGLLYRGVHARPIWYLSTAHSEAEVDRAIGAVADVLAESVAVRS
jgi:glutamate-1-semialdehyde 2,1-aminomutase